MEPVLQTVRAWWEGICSLLSPAESSAWHDGYVCGVLTLALLLLCCMLLWTVFTHRRALKGIVLSSANGSILISARSISDLVKSLDAEFQGIAIRKVSLIQRKKRLVIELNLICQLGASSGNVQEAIESLQAKVLEALKQVFGIATVSQVNVVLSRSRTVREPF